MKSTPRIAVLAVHGVADQSANSTQRMAASLLLGEQLDRNYSEFVEEDILIAQANVKLNRELDLNKTSQGCCLFLKSGVVNRAAVSPDAEFTYKPKPLPTSTSDAPEPDAREFPVEHRTTGNVKNPDYGGFIEHESMREQLQEYTPGSDDATHRSKVLVGTRLADEHLREDCQVDVYELHWADLSRLKNGLFSAFFEFYLLLFFFSRIGTIAIERAMPHYRHNHKGWRSLLGSHLVAEYMLVIAIPVSHLSVLSLTASGVPHFLAQFGSASLFTTHYLQHVFAAITMVILLAGAYAFGKKLRKKQWWLLFPTVAAIVVLLHTTNVFAKADVTLLVATCWAGNALIILTICKIYDKRRPGVLVTARCFLLLTGAIFIALLYSETIMQSSRWLILKVLNTDEFHQFTIPLIAPVADINQGLFIKGVIASLLVVGLVVLSTLIFVLAALLNTVQGYAVIRKTPKAEQSKVARVVWTGVLSLVLPGIAVILVTFSLWQILLWLGKKALPAQDMAVSMLQDMANLLIMPHIVPGAILLAAAIGFAIWVIIPAALTDISDSEDEENTARSLGEILDQAFKKMRWSGQVFQWVLLIGLPLDWLYLITFYPPVDIAQRHLVLGIGIGMFTLLFSGKGVLEKVGVGFRAVLDVGMDVTNWLRVFPRKSNARASICRRYASLLRHVAHWRDKRTLDQYDALVIACHSQGTVITADLLRFLNREHAETGKDEPYDRLLERYFANDDSRIPIYLLTFGSPLRQLYHHRFPHQYAWCGPDTGLVNRRRVHGPDPHSLNVAHWSNIYCSGDYVGRHLWYAEDDDNRWSMVASDIHKNNMTYPNTSELCAGSGGHARYWTGRVKPIAHELDRLIVKAAKAAHPHLSSSVATNGMSSHKETEPEL